MINESQERLTKNEMIEFYEDALECIENTLKLKDSPSELAKTFTHYLSKPKLLLMQFDLKVRIKILKESV